MLLISYLFYKSSNELIAPKFLIDLVKGVNQAILLRDLVKNFTSSSVK